MSDSNLDILPDSRLSDAGTAKAVQFINGMFWRPIYCANCATFGGRVPDDPALCDFAFYLCNECAEKYGAIANTMLEPDAVFFARVAEMQREQYGRDLSPQETLAELDTVDSPLSRLARERRYLTPKGG